MRTVYRPVGTRGFNSSNHPPHTVPDSFTTVVTLPSVVMVPTHSPALVSLVGSEVELIAGGE